MKNFLKITVVTFGIILLTGCAGLRGILQDIESTDASTEINAISTLTNDVVNQPWDNIVQVGLGYALALLRGYYKKKKGAK